MLAPRTPARRPAARARALLFAAGLITIAGHAAAEDGGDPTFGPWLFASVALAIVAWLSWRAGRREGVGRDLPPIAPAPVVAPPVARPAPPAPDLRSIDALCELLGAPVRVFRRGPGGEWVVAASYPPQPEGSTAFDGIPPAVAFAARALAPPAGADVEGWQLRCSGEGAEARLVVRPLPPVPSEDPAALSFTVSHDLRAPVRVVEGFTRILKEDYGRQIDRIGNDHLDRVLAAAARMNAMIDAMLSLARISSQPIARQPVDLGKVAAYVVDELRKNQPERVVDVTIGPDLQVVGDPTLLRQVVENLLSNAWKYTARCERAAIAFTAAERDGRRVYQVRDNGAGFDMRSAERLFGLFQRLHSANEFPGTGVGLASVQRIVRRHRGEIWAEAEPGRGATFSFTLGS